ncbi:MAG: hypothetical protein WHS82_07710 [Candidatus Methanosuratincola sp.]
MARGQVALIDALGAFLIAIAVLSVPFLARGALEVDPLEIAEKEKLRQEFYQLVASGDLTQLLDLCASQGILDTGGIRLSLEEPDRGPYLQFLSSRGGGITLFYITRRG